MILPPAIQGSSAIAMAPAACCRSRVEKPHEQENSRWLCRRAGGGGLGIGDNGLAGSLSGGLPLDVSSVAVIRNDQALVVQYQANRDRDIDLVLRFTLALDELPTFGPGRR